ncbi:MAG: hypothetical protein GX238_06500 [Epulopiscium sp.]|nr:hypothetical protein [Candidatus Epulonipiscium sp.]
MAKGRKKETKLNITSNDKAFFQVLAKSGRTLPQLAEKYFNIKSSRLNRMVKQGWLRKEEIVIDKKATYCLRLTDKSQKWIKNNIETVDRLYKPTMQGTSHDIELFKQLARLPRCQQDVAETETDITYKYGKGKLLSPPDIFVPKVSLIENGQRIDYPAMAIEITTKAYREHHIEAKKGYCKSRLNIQEEAIQFVRVA